MTIQNGEKVTIPVRFVASAGHNDDWAMYMGWSDWSDEEIAGSGDKVREGLARAIIEHTENLTESLAGFLERRYRR